MARKPKAHTLPESTREQIAKTYLRLKGKGARVSFTSLAAAFHCTPMQVRTAVEACRDGKFSGARFKVRPKRASDHVESADSDLRAAVASIDDSDQLFEQEYRKLVIDIARSTMTAAERVQLMHKLTQVRQTMQRVSLGDHMLGIDVEFMKRFVYRFISPEATLDDIIKMIREVKE
jgi:hypothetical protein